MLRQTKYGGTVWPYTVNNTTLNREARSPSCLNVFRPWKTTANRGIRGSPFLLTATLQKDEEAPYERVLPVFLLGVTLNPTYLSLLFSHRSTFRTVRGTSADFRKEDYSLLTGHVTLYSEYSYFQYSFASSAHSVSPANNL